jgi:hypothetical protein
MGSDNVIAIGRRFRANETHRSVRSGEDVFYKAEWMETGEDPILSPTVFMVEQPPFAELFAHFHIHNQFQLFVEGSGRIGGHEIGAVTVHYAGAYTGYGPLVAGPNGIKYFTLRPVFEAGAVPLKGARGRMPKGPKRSAMSKVVTVAKMEMLWRLDALVEEVLIPAAPDGLAAIRTILPPGVELPLMDGGAAQGRFIVVLAGSLIHDGDALTKWESLFATTDEPIGDLRSGPEGADIVGLFTPAKDVHYIGDHIPDFARVVGDRP